MTSRNLISYLKARPQQEPLWLWPDRSVTVAEVKALFGLAPAEWYGRAVAVQLRDARSLAVALAALDGWVSRIVLFPPELEPDLQAEFTQRLQCAATITSGDVFIQLLDAGAKAAASPESTPTAMDTRWVLATSGTSGVPKLVEHTHASLFRSVKESGPGKSGFTWGLLYDLNRFAGLQVFLQSTLGGGALVIPESIGDLSTALNLFAQKQVNALSATPTLWRKILMIPQIELPALKQITMGGEIAEQKILDAVRSKWPKARVTHIYASTEAGVGFSVRDGRAGFPAAWLESGVDSAALKISHDGVLLVRPSNAEQKFLTGENLLDRDGFLRTGDRVQVDGDRVFFLGRDSGAINVGGRKVQPEEVERVLLDHPQVVAAQVSGKKSALTGALVQAEVVLNSGADEKKAPTELTEYCRSRLENFKVPAVIKIVKEIKANAAGKIKRSS